MLDRRSALFLGMGFEVLGAIVGGYFLGQALDAKYKIMGGYGGPMLAGVGLVGWMIHLILIVRKLEKEDESTDSNPPS